uniref:Putative ovule protein n=1 Tax=Solanum chacoense TaxID=4108 RepID=A0A0V0IYP7_SOLCH
MKLGLITAYSRSSPATVTLISGNPHAKTATFGVKFPSSFRLNSGNKISSFSLTICSSKSSSAVDSAGAGTETYNTVDGEISSPQVTESLNVEVGSPKILPNYFPPKLSLSDQAFFLLAFIACTTSVAFTSLVVATVPTLFAMRRAAISLSKLADTAREELPSTMAAIRLSGMEISDLTLELSDLRSTQDNQQSQTIMHNHSHNEQ